MAETIIASNPHDKTDTIRPQVNVASCTFSVIRTNLRGSQCQRMQHNFTKVYVCDYIKDKFLHDRVESFLVVKLPILQRYLKYLYIRATTS